MHVWLPGAYALAEDDLSAMLSAVVSKVPIFGLLVGSYAAIRSEADLGLAHGLGWIGMLTAVAGAMLAVQQDDVKRMLAYSSMSQLGYIITAIALMSHLGWVTAFYLTANHLMTKGIFSRRHRHHSAYRHPHLCRSRRPRTLHALYLRRRGDRHCGHVRPAAARRVRRQMAAVERDDRERLVWADRDGRARDLHRHSLYGALYPGDLSRCPEGRAWARRRGAWRSSSRNIC